MLESGLGWSDLLQKQGVVTCFKNILETSDTVVNSKRDEQMMDTVCIAQ